MMRRVLQLVVLSALLLSTMAGTKESSNEAITDKKVGSSRAVRRVRNHTPVEQEETRADTAVIAKEVDAVKEEKLPALRQRNLIVTKSPASKPVYIPIIQGKSGYCSGVFRKTSWPELKGVYCTYASSKIRSEEPCVTHVQIIPVGTPYAANYNKKRVIVFTDQNCIIWSVPRVG
jgi:hypothetical protein